MLTNLPSVVVMIVFAGGPHTPQRTMLAAGLIGPRSPVSIHLTGQEFLTEYAKDADALREHLQRDPPAAGDRAPAAPLPEVVTDRCSSTLQSCWTLSRHLRRRFPGGCDLLIVTSNYHAPRVRWLLNGLLDRKYRLTLAASRDIPLRKALASPTNRQLVRGEIASWLYCFPVGLACRPWAWILASLAVGLMLAGRGVRSK